MIPGVRKLLVNKQRGAKPLTLYLHNLALRQRDRVAMIDRREDRRLRDDMARDRPLEHELAAISLNPDKMNFPFRDKEQGAHHIVAPEQELARPKIAGATFQGAEHFGQGVRHDCYHVARRQDVQSIWQFARESLMKRLVMCLGFTVIAFAAAAQHHHHHAGHASPYAGQEQRQIKSLSNEDIAELESGGGWGLAKAAELNGVPGPGHLLEMRKEIGLNDDQVARLEAIFKDMQEKAIAEGKRLTEREKALEDAFRAGAVSDETLRKLLAAIEASRSALRYIHLAAHLTSPPLLTAQQIQLYNKLRGYDGDPCAAVPAGHDPKMWRLHNGCR